MIDKCLTVDKHLKHTDKQILFYRTIQQTFKHRTFRKTKKHHDPLLIKRKYRYYV